MILRCLVATELIRDNLCSESSANLSRVGGPLVVLTGYDRAAGSSGGKMGPAVVPTG